MVDKMQIGKTSKKNTIVESIIENKEETKWKFN
jgi:hypothetical protein